MTSRDYFSATRFFNQGTSAKKIPPVIKPGIIPAGRGELAIAMIIIDRFLSPSVRAEDELAQNLLSKLNLFHDYPKYPRPHAASEFLTPTKYMHQLCLESHRSDYLNQLIFSLSATLKRIAIDEIFTNLKYYQHMIVTLKKPLDKNLIQSAYGLNALLSHALSRAIGLNLTQIETRGNKTLPKKTPSLSSNTPPPSLVIHWQDDCCYINAYVQFSDWFSNVNPEKIKSFLAAIEEKYTEVMQNETTTHDIEAHENQLRVQYEEIRLNLYNLIKNENLTDEQIKNLYIESLNQSNTEHGSQHFFEYLYRDKPINPRAYAKEQALYQTRVLDKIIDACAQRIVLGDMPNITSKSVSVSLAG